MWYTHLSNGKIMPIRHWCNQDDKLVRYGWLSHDGRNFGEHEIIDNEYGIISSFVKHPNKYGGDWTVKIKIQNLPGTSFNRSISLIAYIFREPSPSNQSSLTNSTFLHISNSVEPHHVITGYDYTIGKHFKISMKHKTENDDNHVALYGSRVGSADTLTSHVYDHLQVMRSSRGNIVGLPHNIEDGGNLENENGRNFDFVAYQLIASQLPVKMEMTFRILDSDKTQVSAKEKEKEILQAKHDKLFVEFKRKFETKFSKIYGPKAGNQSTFSSPEDQSISRAAFSNLIGGIGYFYGTSLVSFTPTTSSDDEITQRNKKDEPIYSYFPSQLFTAVPSRSFFPRGFLWDEGFHQSILSKWDHVIVRDCLATWFDLLNKYGWIPREQLLGPEARSVVPREFVVQRDGNANPPTLFLALEKLILARKNLKDTDGKVDDTKFWIAIFPRALAWYDWFNGTQTGLSRGTFRWRGRDPWTKLELNPRTLTSGLDDYPRTSHPSAQERHLDLRCWMTFGAKVLGSIAELLKEIKLSNHPLSPSITTLLARYNKDIIRVAKAASYLSSEEELVRLHWNEREQMFSDYGIHAPIVRLEKVVIDGHVVREQRIIPIGAPPLSLRFAGKETFGYVSLFPFIFKLLNPTSTKLNRLLTHDLPDHELLWTNFGIRSLSASSKVYYKVPNTQNDPPYWRGDIWINLNYLILSALKHYSLTEENGSVDPKLSETNRILAANLYNKLRFNLVTNILTQYKRTGYIWERYDDQTGNGKGAHPFTGWSALVTLIIAESY
ncbi:mannosyl-oligosaccharide glucosidase-like [Gordionus sp. m RMFG-2023]|uniref:mannosyl-oligosaccharide glucosidase-like n=1 Tax=Gordionus sp. m RMFG-2023 TaxID=3053472 RepID=UPI0031FE223B